jgi:hypothetical protein
VSLSDRVKANRLNLVLLLVALSGCVASPVPPAPAAVQGAGAAATSEMAPSVTMEGCGFLLASFNVPREPLQGQMPAGFTVPALDPAGLRAGLSLHAWECTQTVAGHAPAVVRELVAVFGVEPPAEYQDPAIRAYAVQLAGFSSSDASLALAHQWGLPGMQRADVTLDVQATPLGTLIEVSASGPNGTAALSGTTASRELRGGGSLSRFFGIADKQVTGAFDRNLTGFDVGSGASRYEGSGGWLVAPPGPTGLGFYTGSVGWAAWPAKLPTAPAS